MPVFRDKKIIFIHIPKTGGTSINHYFGINVNNFKFDEELLYGIEINEAGIGIEWDHATFRMIEEKVKEINKYKIFSVVRNPYDRIMSEFIHYSRMNKKRIITNANTFEDFIKELNTKWDSDKSHFMKGRYLPQYSFIEGCENITILRFEDLNQEFKSFIGGELPFLNKSSYEENFNYLNPETIYIINKLYKKDFEIFGYNMLKTDFKNENKNVIYNFKRKFYKDVNDIEEHDYDINTEENENYEDYKEKKEEKKEEEEKEVQKVFELDVKKVQVNKYDWKNYFTKKDFTIIKVYENMMLYGDINCLCNIIFCEKDNRGYVYMEIDKKIFIIGKKEIEFVNGKGIIDIMCSKCYNQKKGSDICLLIKYEVKKFYGGGIKNAIYLFNEKRWLNIDIFGSIILHGKYINIICSDGKLYKMRLVDFKRGKDDDHIQIEFIKNLIIGGFEDDFKDCFVKYEGDKGDKGCIYEGLLKNGKKIFFNFKKKTLMKI